MDARRRETSASAMMSQRDRTTKSQSRPSIVDNEPAKRTAYASPVAMASTRQLTQRYSTTSVSSSGRRSAASVVDQPPKSAIPRPSGIPRSTSTTSSARLQALASSRPTPTPSMRSRPSPVLDERSKSVKLQSLRATQVPHIKQALKRGEDVLSGNMGTGPGGDVNDQDSKQQPHAPVTNLPPRLIPELQALAYTNRRPILTPGSVSTMSSPSSQFTGSPSPWSASTHTTSSTSWSSASPSILQATRSPVNGKRANTVPVPTSGRSRMPVLPMLQEMMSASKTPSKADLRKDAVTPPRKLRKSPAPTPPPRSSSVKRTRSRSSSKSEEQAPEILAESPPPPLPIRSDQRPSPHMLGNQISPVETRSPNAITAYHHDLQNALRFNSDHVQDVSQPQEAESLTDDEKSAFTPLPNPRTLLDPALIKSKSQPDSTSPVSTTARSRLAKFSKMALFGRSPKDPVMSDDAKIQPRKLQRKGPTAGTGHEGYGRYGRKSRKTSSEGSNAGTDSEGSVRSNSANPGRPSARKSSSASSRHNRNSQSDLDDFAASRMKPVVIMGGSQQPLDCAIQSLKSTDSASKPLIHERGGSPYMHESFAQSTNSPEVSLRDFPTIVPDQPLHDSPSSISGPTMLPHNLETYRLPESIRLRTNSTSQPYAESWNVSQSSFAPSYVTSIDGASDMYIVDPSPVEKQRKKIRRSKWNIFRKRDADIETSPIAIVPTPIQHVDEVAVTLSQASATRQVPYYAMLDQDSDMINAITMDQLLNETTQSFEADDEDGFDTPISEHGYDSRERIESVLLPSAPQFKREISRSRMNKRPAIRILDITDNASNAAVVDQGQRQPRLAQVGRIPKVVPTTNAKLLNRKSFSRPFDRSERSEGQTTWNTDSAFSQETLPNKTYVEPESEATSGIDDCLFQFEDVQHVESRVEETSKSCDRQSMNSSSSDGMISIMGPSLFPPQDPLAASQRKVMTEEDVWNEYDDLLDHVTMGPYGPISATKTHNTTRIGSGEWQSGRRYLPAPKDGSSGLIALAKGLAVDTSITQIPIILSSPDLMQEPYGEEEVRLRRSRIISALHSSMDPSSPFSIGDYLREQGDRQRSSEYHSDYLSGMSDSGTTTPRTVGPSIALPVIPDNQHYENSLQMNDVQRLKNPAKHSELSYASLMISRWLSFGQVLFSPAHTELQRQPEKQVLVIDGLGGDDWSIYCAVTYQAEHAYVYDLKETGGSHRYHGRKADSVPANFRRREIASFNNSFNFPDNFFSVVVLRFPPVMAESKLRNIVSECRRILAPGGYMELMLLDLDIVNMGVLTRRAMRALKTKMTMANPEISLRPLIDNVQNVLGEKGFIKLNRCVVGVPVVGKSRSTSDSPVSSRSSGGSEQTQFSPSAEPHPFDSISHNPSPGFSLHDLVADHSDGADAKISKLVSRTARKWWQSCFESTVIADGNLARSILANKQVLTECKSRASNFKLLIAYAQKPSKPAVELKRRTMSEPFVAKLAPS